MKKFMIKMKRENWNKNDDRRKYKIINTKNKNIVEKMRTSLKSFLITCQKFCWMF